MATHSGTGNFRVLWLGDPRVLPGGGWQIAPGLAYSISENGLGDATEMWSGSSPGAAAAVGRRVDLAERGSTVRLGRPPRPLCHPLRRRRRQPGAVDPRIPVASGVRPAGRSQQRLLSQLDLRQIIGQGGFEVFVDDAALPERAVLTSGQTSTGATAIDDRRHHDNDDVDDHHDATTDRQTATPKKTAPKKTEVATATAPLSPVGADRSLVGWRPVLSGPAGTTAVSGRVPAGTVLAAVAPAGSWHW